MPLAITLTLILSLAPVEVDALTFEQLTRLLNGVELFLGMERLLQEERTC